MDIVVNEDLKAYIDPLTPDEHAALERSILAEGCRDALVLWGDLLVDGHNRYGICQKHGLPFSTVQATQFQTLEDVHLWMIDQHLGRRSISDFQRGVLALRKRDILESRLKAAQTQAAAQVPSGATDHVDHGDDAPVAGDPPFDMDGPDSSGAAPAEAAAPTVTPVDTRLLTSREALAKAARISSSQVRMIEAIQSQAAPEVVAAVKSGDITLSTAAVVASLPADEQVQAAQGGAKELRQAAKRVREAKRKPKPESDTGDESQADAADAPDGAEDTVDSLRARVRELEAENAELRAQLALLQGAALA